MPVPPVKDLVAQNSHAARARRPIGDVYYVDSTNGRDGSSGLEPRFALLTLARALELARAGSTIFLEPGGSETVTTSLAVATAGLKIVCDVDNPHQGYEITGAGDLDLLTVSAADVTLEGLRFTRSAGAGAAVAGVLTTAAADRLTVRNCAFDYRALTSAWSNFGIEVTDNCEDLRVLDCFFADCHRGVTFVVATGVNVLRPRIERCVFYVGQDTAFGVHTALSGTGAVLSPTILDCEFHEADGDGTASTDLWDGTDGTDATTGPISYGAAVDQWLTVRCVAFTILSGAFSTLNAINAGAVGSNVQNLTTAGLGDATTIYSDTTIIASDVVIVVSDTTAIHLQTTTIASDTVQVYSDTTIVVSDTTAIHSDTTAINTQTTTIASDLVIVTSDTTAVHSDTTIIASDVVIVVSDTTAVHLQTTTIASDVVIVTSDTTAIHSDTTIVVSDTTAIHLQTTTIASDTVQVYSDTTAVHSDTTIIASDVVIVVSDTTAIHSDTTIIASDVVQLVGGRAVFNTGTKADIAGIPNNAEAAGGLLVTATGGPVLIDEILVAKDATALTGPTNIRISADGNTYGPSGVAAPIVAIATAAVTANVRVGGLGTTVWTTLRTPFVLESGVGLYIHGDDSAGTSAGNYRWAVRGRAFDAATTLVGA